jgi:hypothetical protein
VYPGGGPIDTESPKIINTYPIPNSLKVKTNIIHFEFDKYIDRNSFEGSIYISPTNPIPPEFDWSGKEVDLILPYELKQNKTYTITIGTDVVDIHNRNRMADSYTLAFSTGEKIDSGFISGKIFDENQQGILIIAYRIDSLNPDTLDPSKVFPDYTTQSGKKGEYSLKFLSNGKYRIFTIKDEYKNILYDPGIDKIGMSVADYEVNNENKTINDVNFKLALFDTTAPKLYSAEAVDNQHVLLKFSKNINLASLSVDNFVITDSISGHPLKINQIFMVPFKKNNFKLLTDKQEEKKYLLSSSSISDSSNHPIDPDYSKVIFNGTLLEDTTKPVIQSISVSDSLRNFRLTDEISLKFNDIIKKDIFERSLKIVDTNNLVLKTEFKWNFNSEVIIKPPGLKFNSWYRLEFSLDSLVKYNNVRAMDSTLKINFRTEDKNILSSLSGILVSDEKRFNYLIEATNLEVKTRYYSKIQANQKFDFENIPEGRYILFTFLDIDSNGVYSYGNPHPFRTSEKFYYLQDTIKVRARWPVEDVKIKFE